MQAGRIGRIIVSRIAEGEDLFEAVKKRADDSHVKAGFFSAIGSLDDVTMGYYRNGKYEYRHLEGPLEIASCTGNIALNESGEIVIHGHIVVSDESFTARGGHLVQESHVGATAELVIVEGLDLDLRRVFDEKTKLKLLKLG